MSSEVSDRRGPLIVAARVSPEVFNALKARGAAEDRTISSLVRRALQQFIVGRATRRNDGGTRRGSADAA